MIYKIIIEKDVAKFLDKIDDYIVEAFYKKIKILSVDIKNVSVDIKRLKWNDDLYRLRIGKYRFVYKIYNEKLVIVFVDADSRWDIYK